MSTKGKQLKQTKNYMKEYKRQERNAKIIQMINDGYTVQQIADSVGLSKGRITQIKHEMLEQSLAKKDFIVESFANKMLNHYQQIMEDIDERIALIERDLAEDGKPDQVAGPGYFEAKRKVVEDMVKLFSIPTLFEEAIKKQSQDNTQVVFSFKTDTQAIANNNPDVDSNENQKAPETVTEALAREVLEGIIEEGAYSEEDWNKELQKLNEQRRENGIIDDNEDDRKD